MIIDTETPVKSGIGVSVAPFTNSKRTSHEIEQYAEQHGTTAAAYVAAGWSPDIVERKGRPALTFKTKTGRRWRYVDGQKPKYDHDTDYHACWYGLERAVQYFKLPYIVDCNGAPSTVPAQAKGVPAFSYQSGEMTAPTADRIAELKAVCPGKIYVAFDCDADGRAGAIKRVQLYRANGIDVDALDLGLPEPGADLADFLKTHTLADLLALPRLAVPDPEPRTRKIVHFPETDQTELARLALAALDGSRRDLYYAWVEVGMALQELGEVGLALWDSWSAGSDKYKAGDCAKKWKSFRRSDGKTLASLFYMADSDYGPTWRPLKPSIDVDDHLSAAPAQTPEVYPESLPIAVRGAFNAYTHPSVAPILELWLEGIQIGALEPGEPATIECLVHISKLAKRGLSLHTIRTGLQRGADPHGAVFLRVLPDHSITSINGSLESEGGKTQKNPCKTRKGRFPEVYDLLPWQTILANLARLAVAPTIQRAFPVEDETVAPIRTEFLAELGQPNAEQLARELNERYAGILEAQPGYRTALDRARKDYQKLLWALENPQMAPVPDGWTYKNTTEYMACCARAIVEAAGGETQYGRQRLADLIGCSLRSLGTVLKRAGIAVAKDQTTDVAVRNMAQLRGVKREYSARQRGYPVAVVSSLNSAPYSLDKKGALVWAEGEFKRGATVSVRYQQANRQTIETPDQPRKAHARLAYAVIVFLKSLLAWLIAHLIAEPVDEREAAPEAVQRPLIARSAWVRLHVQLQLKRLFEWLTRNYRPKLRKESYHEQWLRKVTSKVTTWQADPDRLVDRETGEVAEFSIQQTLDKLLEPVNKPAQLMTGIMDDPLIQWLVTDCGGRVAA